MARLTRKLRVCKWTGTVCCVLIVAAWAVSGWWAFDSAWASAQDGNRVGLYRGDAFIGHGPTSRYVPRLGWHLWWHYGAGLPLQGLARLPKISIEYPTEAAYPGNIYRVAVPLWLPFLVLLIPTLLLWRRDRRESRPGFCRRCAYDLTGNTSGVCPECGGKIPV